MIDTKPRTVKLIAATVLLLMLFTSMSGCLDGGEVVENTITIGAVYPITGALSGVGEDAKNGITLALDIINNVHDLDLPMARTSGLDSHDGAKLEMIFGDSQGDPAIGVTEAERLIDIEKVVALMGCYQSSVTDTVSQVTENRSIPMVSDSSSAAILTERGFEWFFRTTPHDGVFVANFMEFLDDIKVDNGINVDRIAVVYEDTLWGSEFGKEAIAQIAANGYQLVENISYSASTTNVTSEVQRLIDANPDVVMQVSYTNDAILFIQTYKEMGFNPDAILANNGGFNDPDFLGTLGDDGNYSLTRATWSKDLGETKPLVETVNEMYKEKFGKDMNSNSARAFTGMLVLADAINRAASTGAADIKTALLATDIAGDELIMPWDGVEFDQTTHQNTQGKGIINQIIDQEYRIVWPADLATEELVWPMP